MGIIGNLVKAAYTMADFDKDVKERFLGHANHSGVTVNEGSALRYVTVYSCVRVLAEAQASLPLILYKKRPKGGADKAEEHPLYGLLHDLPNDEMTSVTWRETSMGHLTLSGNCYSIITRNKRGQVIDIYPVDWNLVEPKRAADGKVEYLVKAGQAEEVYPAERIFHIPLFGFDGIKGYSPIRMANEAIGLGMAAAEFAARFYGQGMNVGGVLEHPGTLSDEAQKRLKASIEERGSGLANSWRPLILEENMKFSRIPMPLTEAQFIENRKFTREEIAGLFRVPPHMIADLSQATFSNIEYQSLDFVMHSLLPYLTRWEQAINWKLLTPQERTAGYYAKFNVAGLLRGDYKSRQEGLQLQRQNGVINADEWRELEEMNPQEGGTGQVYMVNGNMMPIAQAGQGGSQKGGAASGQ